MRRAPRRAALAAAALALGAIAAPWWCGTPDEPTLSASAAQLLPPGTVVAEAPLAGGGFVRARAIRELPEGIAVVDSAGERVFSGESLARPARERRMLLGTDHQGRDLLARAAHGARRSAGVAAVAAAVALGVGSTLGFAAAAAPGWLATIVRVAADGALGLPRLLLLMILGVVLRRVPFGTALAIGLASWMELARLVEADARAGLSRPFAAAARAAGAGRARLVLRHVLPNVAPLLAAVAPLVACDAVLVEAALSWLGVTADAGASSWGRMVADGERLAISGWWISAVPGALLVGTALALHAVAAPWRAGELDEAQGLAPSA